MEKANVRLPSALSGIVRSGGEDLSRHVGEILRVQFPPVASVGAGAALTTIQSRLAVAGQHRRRGAFVASSDIVAVAPGTDPTVDIYVHLPVPAAPTAALISPAAAGNVNTGAHKYAVTFVSAAGETTPSPVTSKTVADAAVNGKVVLGIPLGPTGTTQRKIYRTAAAGTALLLLATVANNTAVTYTDNIADSSLGAAAPTNNTAAATILTAPIALSEAASDRELNDQPLSGVMADVNAPVECEGCIYSLRASTGASTGAITNLSGWLEIELLA